MPELFDMDAHMAADWLQRAPVGTTLPIGTFQAMLAEIQRVMFRQPAKEVSVYRGGGVWHTVPSARRPYALKVE